MKYQIKNSIEYILYQITFCVMIRIIEKEKIKGKKNLKNLGAYKEDMP